VVVAVLIARQIRVLQAVQVVVAVHQPQVEQVLRGKVVQEVLEELPLVVVEAAQVP
jgi:hypothetical protein